MQTLAVEGALVQKVVSGLSKSLLFAGLKPDSLQQVAVRGELEQYEQGETIFEEGEPSDSFFFVLSGEVRVQVRGDKLESTELGVLKPSECFGEMGLLLESPRSATVIAKNRATLLKFPSPIFEHFMQRVPDFGIALARFLATRLAHTSQQIPLPSAGSAEVPPAEVLELLPREIRERHRIVPLSSEGNVVRLGCVYDPTPHALTLVRQQLRGMEIELTRISEDMFERCMRSSAGLAGWGSEGLNEEDEVHLSSPKLDVLLKRMVAEGASDLHLSSKQEPRWRIDGEMEPIAGIRPLTSKEVFELVEPIMREATKREYHETHDADFAYSIEGVSRFRVNLFKDRGGVSAVFRQIPDRILTVEQLGLPGVVQSICDFPKGLILVTGPTGSGKSTTLAAMIDYVNKTKKGHIITLEDPIEFVHRSRACLINQREIGQHTTSFSRALKAALREDPDIVLVGEMRDLETVSLALETANTGHLVFGTLHTSTAISTVDRIIDLFPAEQQSQVRMALADTLRAVVAQTLCRKIGGGRVAALEILVSNHAVANLIRESKNAQIISIMTTQRALGNRLLTEELAQLVKEGRVSYDEALAKAVDKHGLAKLCNQNPPKL